MWPIFIVLLVELESEKDSVDGHPSGDQSASDATGEAADEGSADRADDAVAEKPKDGSSGGEEPDADDNEVADDRRIFAFVRA
jgi:hypothetical protein